MVKVISSENDDLRFVRAYIGEDAGAMVPLAVLRGTSRDFVCELGDKQSLVDAGLVACWPVEHEWAENWPIQCVILREDSDGNGREEVLHKVTTMPELVAAVRHWLSLIGAGKARVGMEL